MLWVPSIRVHMQYGTRAKLNRKNHKQQNQKHDHGNWELNKITKGWFGSKTEPWRPLALGGRESNKMNAYGNGLEVRKELRQIILLKTREVNISKTSGRRGQRSRDQATELNNKVKGNLRGTSENWNILRSKSKINRVVYTTSLAIKTGRKVTHEGFRLMWERSWYLISILRVRGTTHLHTKQCMLS